MIVRTKIIGHYSLFVTHYSLLITRNTNTLIFVLKMFTFVYDRRNENHWSLLSIRYSLLITRNTNTLPDTIKIQAVLINFVQNGCFVALRGKFNDYKFHIFSFKNHATVACMLLFMATNTHGRS